MVLARGKGPDRRWWLRTAQFGTVTIALFRALPASATVRVQCAELAPETSAQVEARLRASVLSVGAPEPEIDIGCNGAFATVLVVREERSGSERVRITGEGLHERLIDATERGLALVMGLASDGPVEASETPKVEPEPKEASAGPEVSSSQPVGTSIPPPTPLPQELQVAQPARRTSRSAWQGSRVRALGVLELHGGTTALGGEVGMQNGDDQLWYGIASGVLSADPRGPFSLTDWHSSVEVGWQPPHLRASLSAGVSLLVVDAQNGILGVGDTALFTPFIEARIAYPLTWGSIAVLPGIGARFFLSERAITLDGEPQPVLSSFAPRVSVAVLYGFGT